ncbi:MFS general substrate transporter [Hypoxylon trugodes]|uniref:MFS general substrate transporter n=1 Tax=Hypoxylon trugodes TaxID=326681 RepID=UPI00218FB6F4|nr:MFS general substrate transporter [Hypoxylon trugodes]KAI1384363.1 MFS general substrate transporter [Hypoxylon trugodes]
MDQESRTVSSGMKTTSVGRPPGTIDAHAERRLVRKIDFYVWPILFVIYVMSFLDRINISNARIQGMTEDLNLYGSRFNIALFVYFVPYILLEVPSNMILRKVHPPYYLPFLMFSWAIINMCMGFIKTYQGLVALRFFLGVFEAGIMPAIIYLTSMYYKRHEFQTRISFFFCSTVISGAFGGLLAYAIASLNGRNGLSGWRWIFIIEGAATVAIAIISIFFIVDWPEKCHFLSPEEKQLLQMRLADDGTGGHVRMDTLNTYAYRLILTDWKIWLGGFIYMGVGTTGYATTFFMPTILREFGWEARAAQVHTIPVYAVSAVGMVSVSYLSDRLKHRYGFIMLGCVIATIGYGILLCQGGLSSEAKYGAVFLVSLGGFVCNPIALAWLNNNVAGHWKRSFASAIQVALGNVCGIVAAVIFREDEAPRYPTGYGTAVALMWFGAIAASLLFAGLLVENKMRDAGKRDGRLTHPKEEVDNMGDYHPSFRFTL